MDLSWCVNDVSLLSSSAPSLPRVLRPKVAQICIDHGTPADRVDSRSADSAVQKGATAEDPMEIEPEWRGNVTHPQCTAYDPLRQLVQDSFGYADFKSFQFPVIRNVLAVSASTVTCRECALVSPVFCQL